MYGILISQTIYPAATSRSSLVPSKALEKVYVQNPFDFNAILLNQKLMIKRVAWHRSLVSYFLLKL